MSTIRDPRRVPLPVVALVVAGLAGCGPAPPAETPTPDPASAGVPWFEEIGPQAGLVFEHVSGFEDRFYMPEIVGGGAALFDMDGDGDLDAYLVQGGRLTDPPERRPGNRLFRNRGDGSFDDISSGSGATDRGYGMGVAVGDYDGDGRPDLYVTNVGANVLLRNEGEGRFADVTAAAGVGHEGWGTSAAFLDYDNDGWLDLFVVNYVDWALETEITCTDAAGAPDYCSPVSYEAPSADVLYRNNGDGTFRDVSIDAGLRTSFGNGLGVVCVDVDRDGLVDVYVANDKTPNHLWMNAGDGTFRDEAHLRGCALDLSGAAKAGMGTAAADVDGNGWPDVLVVNLRTESDELFLNEGGYFRDHAAQAGLGVVSRPYTRFGVGLIDFDNDGRLDLFQANGRVVRGAAAPIDPADPFAEPNLLLAGGGDGRWTEVLPRGGTARRLVETSRAAAFGDVDNDGGVDILVVNRDGPAHLLHNIAASRGRWIAFRVLDRGGRDAYGARLSLRLGERVITREVRSAYSYLAANDARVYVGLGAATTVQSVEVVWPGGQRERFGDREADQIVVVRQGHGEPAPRTEASER